MVDDLIPILTRFHREIVLPDIKRLVGDALSDLELRLNAHFDGGSRSWSSGWTSWRSSPICSN